ncbi:MAG: hypothetical protein VX346_08370 [Planctomycetota bacterium]|nr:hypothetical protein [Planctomycetota bacterium]
MMHSVVQNTAAVLLSVIGLSYLVRHRHWAAWHSAVCTRGPAGLLPVTLCVLTAGAVIVSCHNVWTGIPAILTSLGWSLVLKAGVALVFPDMALSGMARVTPAHSRLLWLPGSIMLAIGILLVWSLYTRETGPLP